MTMDMKLESAIPAHLVHPASGARPRPSSPPYPSFVGRFSPEIGSVVMAYFGSQSADATHPELFEGHRALAEVFDSGHGPGHVDRAIYEDELGYTNVISIAYWTSTEDADLWLAVHGAEWTDPDRPTDGIGYFLERLTPSTERFETLFSANDRVEGVAGTADRLSGEIAEHGYWGGARDRFPRSQHDRMTGIGTARVQTSGRVQIVEPQHNICLIRSGQDYTDADDTERAFYLREVEPVLRAGMEFLRDDGRPIGCYANRYMTVLDDDLKAVGKTFGMSWWNDLAALEAWSKSHETHVKIFGAAMRHLSTFGPETRLRLYHEVTVAALSEQSFIYLGCHPKTGMLRAAEMSSLPTP